jgi:signal transduction histidine kinase
MAVQAIQHLLILYSAILLFNTVVSGMLWMKERSPLLRYLFLFWSTGCLAVVIQGVTAQSSVALIAFGATSTWLANFFLANMIAQAVGFKLPSKLFLALVFTGYVFMAVIAHLGIGFPWIGIPVSIAAIPIGYASLFALIKYRSDLTFSQRGLTISALCFSIHAMDYPLLRPFPELVPLGFTISIFIAFAISVFALAVVSEALVKNAAAFKMAALGEMAGGIAHEINTPLTVIQLRAGQLMRLLDAETPDRRMAVQSTESIQKTAARIASIIKGLRFFSREAGTDPFQSVAVKVLVEETFDLCRERFKASGITILLDELPADLAIQCRFAQMEQVLLSLLMNSFDAIASHREKWVKVGAHNRERTVEISVTDSGSGLPKEIQSKLFQPFFTTKKIGEGTGLGLSVSKGIVESHGGTLRLDTARPNTTFVIEIPKAPDKRG